MATPVTSSQPSASATPEVIISRATGEGDFDRGSGLRDYASYRNLGIEKASGGLLQVQQVRLHPPCTDKVRKYHIHALNFQAVYVLKGWIKMEFEGLGELVMNQGDCWIQPPNSVHKILDYSDDFEDLEINCPARFDTIEV